VIVEQDNNAAMRAEPHFNIRYDVISNKTLIDMTMIQLTGTPNGVSGTDFHTINSKLVQSIGKSNTLYWTAIKGFQYGQNLTFNITTKYGPLWNSFFESKLENLPDNIRNSATNLTMTSEFDKQSDETTYNIILQINQVNVLDNKKGIVEIKVD
jgi:hypothetical protein